MQATTAQSGTPDTGTPPATGGGISGVGALTTIHFVIIGVLLLLTLLAIFYGVGQARKRRQAEREERERIEVHAQQQERSEEQRLAPPPLPARPAPAPGSATDADAPAAGSLTQLKGVGPKVAARLAELGFTTVGQIAALSDEEADALDARLGPFSGRIARDRWIEQARFLAAGDKAGFEAVFGRL